MDSSQQQTPYHVRMDSEDALKLVKQGASLLLLGVPPSTSFGIDQQMFVVGPNFKGVKMMPPGPHFIYYSAASRCVNFLPLKELEFQICQCLSGALVVVIE